MARYKAPTKTEYDAIIQTVEDVKKHNKELTDKISKNLKDNAERERIEKKFIDQLRGVIFKFSYSSFQSLAEFPPMDIVDQITKEFDRLKSEAKHHRKQRELAERERDAARRNLEPYRQKIIDLVMQEVEK